MQDFTFYNPTKYIFGKTAFNSLRQETEKIGKKVLITFGGGSIKKNGVYERVLKCLEGFEIMEFGGIEPNPRLETINKAIEIAREFKPDLILAVGGGSVIDGSKLLAAATYYQGDAWDVVTSKGESIAEKIIPLGVVLTISATGSEVNGNSVITKWETHEKNYFGLVAVNPVFSIVDPEVQYSLPIEQVAYGIIDAYSHILEQYLNQTTYASVQDRFSEGLLQTLIEYGPQAIKDPKNYDVRSNVVFAASMALNNLIGSGVAQDWATHDLEHVISGFYDIAHGAGLAVITSRWMKVIALEQKFNKMVQYGKRVWQLTGSDAEIAQQAIEKTYEFFASLGVKMNFTDWGIVKEDINKIVAKSVEMGPIGEEVSLTEMQMREILENCF